MISRCFPAPMSTVMPCCVPIHTLSHSLDTRSDVMFRGSDQLTPPSTLVSRRTRRPSCASRPPCWGFMKRKRVSEAGSTMAVGVPIVWCSALA